MQKFINKSELVMHGVTRFATTFLTLQRLHKNPILEEKMYGAHTPHLQNVVIKVLSLIYNSSACKLYVKYNQALHECYECHDPIDLIALKEIDDSNEWKVGELDGDGKDAKDELIFYYDDVLTWRDVASATKAAELLKYIRRQTQMQKAVVAFTSKKEKGEGVVEEEDEEDY
ncbi:hypothetical protein CR513_09034, partial [Mucuna pruriens]